MKIGVYVDAANISRNGGWAMNYSVLREFAERGKAIGIRYNTYITYDAERGRTDIDYRNRMQGYYENLRIIGWKVKIKEYQRYYDDQGNVSVKANSDLDMAVDALLQSKDFDKVLLATGDGDFLQVVNAIQNQGCRVELVAFNNVSRKLKEEVDRYFSGYFIPNLLPIEHHNNGSTTSQPLIPWGEIGSRVRGFCNIWFSDKGFGFLHFFKHINSNMWIIDPKDENTPYGHAYFHVSSLAEPCPEDRLQNKESVFEFTIKEGKDGRFQAENVFLVT